MNLIKLNATDSTNDFLKELARKTDLPDETVVVAHDQTKGRGQMGNAWQSVAGESLTFSMFKSFDNILAEQQFMVSMAVSIAIAEVMDSLFLPGVSIKWPNDILSENKKIGGVLIENVIGGSWIKNSIIGIGLNINETSFVNLEHASSLKLQMGKTFALERVLKKVATKIFEELRGLQSQDISQLKEKYENNLFRRNEVSDFETKYGIPFKGIIKGVSDLGELLMAPVNEPIQKYQMKQVKLIY